MALWPRRGRHAPEPRRAPIASAAPEQHAAAAAAAVIPPALKPAASRAAGAAELAFWLVPFWFLDVAGLEYVLHWE